MPDPKETLKCLSPCQDCPNRITPEEFDTIDDSSRSLDTWLEISEKGISGIVSREVFEGMYKGEVVQWGAEMLTPQAIETISDCSSPDANGKCAALEEIFEDAENGWNIHEHADRILNPEHLTGN